MKKVEYLFTLIAIVFVLGMTSCDPNEVKLDDLTLEGGLTYHDGKLFSGIGFETWSNTSRKSSFEYIDGVRTEMFTYWHENGVIALSTEFSEKTKWLERKEWNSEGVLHKVTDLKPSGELLSINEYYDDGTRKSYLNYLSGEIVSYHTYFPNGKIESRLEDRGNKERLSKYYENGELKSEEILLDETPVGLWMYYDSSGSLVRVRDFENFENGHTFNIGYISRRITGEYVDRTGNFHLSIEWRGADNILLFSKSYNNNYGNISNAARHQFESYITERIDTKRTKTSLFFQKNDDKYVYEVDFESQTAAYYKEEGMELMMTFFKK